MGHVSAAIMPLSALVIGQANAAAIMTNLTGPDGLLMQAMPIAAMFAVIYFLLIRPSKAQRDQQAQLLAALKKDDDVMTSGGILGRIYALDDKVVTLEVADKVRMRVQRSCIVGLAEGMK